MNKISYVNGEFVDHENATIHIEDRGYVFSDGVYEVALAIKGVLIDWQEHCQRLTRSLAGLHINYQVDSEYLTSNICKLLDKNLLQDAIIYLQITRGVAPRLHQFPTPEATPVLTITVSPLKLPSQEIYDHGAKAITTPDIRWKRRDLKTISLLPNIMAKQEAIAAGAEEAILFEENYKVTEGSSTNVFIVDNNGRLHTHPANENILGGITRKGVLQVARDNGVEVVEESFDKDEMMGASEAFITSTTKHILPITNIDGQNIGDGNVGQVTKKLMDLYKNYIDKQVV